MSNRMTLMSATKSLLEQYQAAGSVVAEINPEDPAATGRQRLIVAEGLRRDEGQS